MVLAPAACGGKEDPKPTDPKPSDGKASFLTTSIAFVLACPRASAHILLAPTRTATAAELEGKIYRDNKSTITGVNVYLDEKGELYMCDGVITGGDVEQQGPIAEKTVIGGNIAVFGEASKFHMFNGTVSDGKVNATGVEIKENYVAGGNAVAGNNGVTITFQGNLQVSGNEFSDLLIVNRNDKNVTFSVAGLSSACDIIVNGAVGVFTTDKPSITTIKPAEGFAIAETV